MRRLGLVAGLVSAVGCRPALTPAVEEPRCRPEAAAAIPASPPAETLPAPVTAEALDEPSTSAAAVEDAELKLALDEAHAQTEELGRQLEQAQQELASRTANKRKPSAVVAAALAAEQARAREAKRRLAELRALARDLGALLQQPGVDLRLDEDLVRIEIQLERLFEPRKTSLTEEGTQLLLAITAVLARRPQARWQIEGHFDSTVVRQARFRNSRELSFAQASAVAELIERNGVAAPNLGVAGYGGARPIADNTTEEGRALNRRIDIVVVPSFSWLPGALPLRRAINSRETATGSP